jgi:hypothetical protein
VEAGTCWKSPVSGLPQIPAPMTSTWSRWPATTKCGSREQEVPQRSQPARRIKISQTLAPSRSLRGYDPSKNMGRPQLGQSGRGTGTPRPAPAYSETLRGHAQSMIIQSPEPSP